MKLACAEEKIMIDQQCLRDGSESIKWMIAS